MAKAVHPHHKRSQKKMSTKGASSKFNKFKKNKTRKVKNEERSRYSHPKPSKGNAKDINEDIEVPTEEVFSKPKSKSAKHQSGVVVENNCVELNGCIEQLKWFTGAFRAAYGSKLSSLEVDEIPGIGLNLLFAALCGGWCMADNSFMELSNTMDHSIQNLSEQVKIMFGPSWKEVLCEENLLEGSVEPGSPAILLISSSAIRCVELLRGLQTLTTKCHAAKLFAKHIKIEEQMSILKGRVNIAGGTPSRIKKLIDTDALGLSRLSIVLLDMHKDIKGFTLFTIPQVSTEFWELYRTYFHQQVAQGKLQLCLY